jgi:hypothetical protein
VELKIICFYLQETNIRGSRKLAYPILAILFVVVVVSIGYYIYSNSLRPNMVESTNPGTGTSQPTVLIPTITSPPTRLYEKLEMRTAYSSLNTNSTWTVVLGATNTGSTDASIISIMINGRPYTTFTNVGVNSTLTMGIGSQPVSITTGQSKTLYVNIPQSAGFMSGQTIELSLVAASGTNYPKEIVLG